MKNNPILQAIAALGGSPEDVAFLCKVSRQTVYNWLVAGRVRQLRHGILLADAMEQAGHPISLRALAGMPPARSTTKRAA